MTVWQRENGDFPHPPCRSFSRASTCAGPPILTIVGASLEIEFPTAVEGSLALGYGSHFGLGLLAKDRDHQNTLLVGALLEDT